MAVLSRVLPSPGAHAGVLSRVGWWAAILVGSLAAMWLVDRATRRLAPLAALLDMAVLFPGRAPTRFKVARKAGDLRQLTALTEQANNLDGRSGLADAAEQILALVGSMRAHDRHTRGHSERVRVYTDLIAAQMRLTPAAIDRLRWAALLHDIGKLRVPRSTLNKPAKLSAAEWETIRQHPLAGADLAAALLPWLGEWGKAIAEHHERFDGTGYPLGMSGRDISVAGRIVALADSFEVMTAARTYKKAMTRGAALAEVVKCSGTQFDPDVVRALLEVSAPRLRWAMGPMSWLVGTPLLGSAPSLTAAGVAAQAAVGVSAVAVAGMTGVAGPALAANTSPASVPSAQPTIATHAAVAPTHPATPSVPRVATKHSAPRRPVGPPAPSAPSSPTQSTPITAAPAPNPRAAIATPTAPTETTSNHPAKPAAPTPKTTPIPTATPPATVTAPAVPAVIKAAPKTAAPTPTPSATTSSNSGKGGGNSGSGSSGHGHGHGWGHGSGG
jgi:putative nucleotidyltransferase with HDIG domain